VFARWNDDETLAPYRARVRGLFVSVNSTSENERIEFVNRDFNIAIKIRRCAVLKTRPTGLWLSNFMEQPLGLEAYDEKLKQIARVQLQKAEKRLRLGRYTSSTWSCDLYAASNEVLGSRWHERAPAFVRALARSFSVHGDPAIDGTWVNWAASAATRTPICRSSLPLVIRFARVSVF